MGDALFPFPEPSWIFIHDIWIIDTDGGLYDRQYDERGKAIPVDLDALIPLIEPVKGYLTAGDFVSEKSRKIEQQRIDAVCLFPRDFAITSSCLIWSNDPQIPLAMRGWYLVNQVRPSVVHTRTLVSRDLGIFAPEAFDAE